MFKGKLAFRSCSFTAYRHEYIRVYIYVHIKFIFQNTPEEWRNDG